MSDDIIDYHEDGNIAFLRIADRIDHPDKVVRLSNEAARICSEIVFKKDVRVIVLEGSVENAFSMGGDLFEEIKKTETHKNPPSLANKIGDIDRPVVAAIRGDAVGLGLELALACDLRIGTDGAQFGLTHISHGLIPWDGGTQRLSRLIGRGKALEMTLTGQPVDAQEALRLGLVNSVVSGEELEGVAADMAGQMAMKAPFSMAYAKETIHRGMDLTLEQGLRLEADLYFLMHTTEDRREGITAFQEKRKPWFQGK